MLTSVTRLDNFWTLGNFLKHLATINLPKYPTFLGIYCKGVKIYHFSCEIIFGQLIKTIGDFFLVTLMLTDFYATRYDGESFIACNLLPVRCTRPLLTIFNRVHQGRSIQHRQSTYHLGLNLSKALKYFAAFLLQSKGPNRALHGTSPVCRVLTYQPMHWRKVKKGSTLSHR